MDALLRGYPLQPEIRSRDEGGEIRIERPDGRLAALTLPGQPERPVALKRRGISELLAEELRRLDPDEIYEQTVASMVKLDTRERGTGRTSGRTGAKDKSKAKGG